MLEEHGEVVTRLDVAQHEERDEDEPQAHQDGKPDAVFARLQGKAQTSTAEAKRRFQFSEKLTLLDTRPLLSCCVQEHVLWITAHYFNQTSVRFLLTAY